MVYKVSVTIEFEPSVTVERVEAIRDAYQKALQATGTTCRAECRSWSIKHELNYGSAWEAGDA